MQFRDGASSRHPRVGTQFHKLLCERCKSSWRYPTNALVDLHLWGMRSQVQILPTRYDG